MTERALVLDAEKRQSLVAVRSLGRRGIDVTAGSTRRFSPGSLSTHASRRLRYPPPDRRPEAFVDAVLDELDSRAYDVLLPVRETTLAAVDDHREALESRVAVPLPPTGTLRYGLDKHHTIAAASDAGIPHPATMAPETLDVDAVASELGYPVVVKPRRGAGRVGVSVCHTPRELSRTYAAARDRHGPLLLQEFVPNGGERGVYALYDRESRLGAVTVQERLRAHPPEGGSSTLRETVSDPALVSLADELLSAIDWQGVAMVEFRVDARDGTPTLMEINPRLWGSLALSVFAGVDFPYLLYRLAVDGETDRSLDYAVGVQSRRLVGDVSHLLSRDDVSAALHEFLQPAAAPRRYDVLSRSDPLPFVSHAAGQVAGFVRRRLRRSP